MAPHLKSSFLIMPGILQRRGGALYLHLTLASTKGDIPLKWRRGRGATHLTCWCKQSALTIKACQLSVQLFQHSQVCSYVITSPWHYFWASLNEWAPPNYEYFGGRGPKLRIIPLNMLLVTSVRCSTLQVLTYGYVYVALYQSFLCAFVFRIYFLRSLVSLLFCQPQH